MNFKRILGLAFALFGICGSVCASPLQSVELFMPGKDRARFYFRRQDNFEIRSTSAEEAALFVNRKETPQDASHVYCVILPSRELPEFTRAEFRVNVFLPPDQPLRSYLLVLRDADGEGFHIAAPLPKADGQWHELMIPVDAANPRALRHWGAGKKADGKLTMPITFTGVIGDFGEATGRVGLGRIQCDILDSNAPLAPELRTGSGSPIHVLKKGEEQELALLLRNPRDRALSGSLTWVLIGVRGEALGGATEKVALKVGEEKHLALPLPTRFGVYKLRMETVDDDPSVRKFEKEMSFAYLNPAGPTEGFSNGFLFGVNAHPDRYSFDDRNKEAMAAAWCGVKAMRTDLTWKNVQPAEGLWEFDMYDKIIDVYGKYGIEVMPLYMYAPAWAVAKDWKPANPKCFPQPRPDYGHWRKYVETVAKRYRDKIRYIEVWNEPDLYGFANFSEKEYVRMLEIAYAEVKRLAPEWKVLCGGFAGLPGFGGKTGKSAMMPAVIQSGKYDIFAFHGHGPFGEYRNRIESLFTYGNRKPWYANETAIAALGYGEETQARTLFQKLIFSWAKGSIGFNWYDLRNDGFDPTNGEHTFGMITFDFYPKPVYAAYNALANLYRDGKFLHEVPLGKDLCGYLFRGRDGELLLAAWSTSGDAGKQPLTVAGITGQAEVVDLYGNATALAVENGSATVEVGAEPLTLRVTGQQSEIKIAKALVHPTGDLQIVPGGEAVFEFELHNPETKERSFRVRLTLPAGLSTEAKPETLRLAPGETRKLSFPVRAKADFRSLSGKLKGLTLSVGNRRFRFRIDSVIPVSEKGYRAEPDFVLNSADQLRALFPVSPEYAHLVWKGARDLSAKVWLGRDGETLLLKAEVVDDKHAQPYSGDETWKGDNIQFALALPGQKDFWELGLTRLESGKNEVYAWRAPSSFQAKEAAAKIALTTSRDDQAGLTVYEARIPLSAIGLSEEAGRAGFRFNLLVNDNDGSGRESFLMIAPGLGDTKEPERYPIVKF